MGVSRIEAYIRFARFCIENHVSPTKVGDLIGIVKAIKDTRNFAQRQVLQNNAVKLAKELGFEEPNFYSMDKFSFIDKASDRVQLPEII